MLRVIENEDGSYSPYSNNDKSIQPPMKPNRKENNVFQRLVEDNDMSTKIANLRTQMNNVSIRRQVRQRPNNREMKNKSPPTIPPPLTFKFLTDCANDTLLDNDINIIERTLDEESHSESEEIALKDKHRSKQNRIPFKSKYSENKGVYSHVKQNYARIHKRQRDFKAGEGTSTTLHVPYEHEVHEKETKLGRNRLHLARLVSHLVEIACFIPKIIIRNFP